MQPVEVLEQLLSARSGGLPAATGLHERRGEGRAQTETPGLPKSFLWNGPHQILQGSWLVKSGAYCGGCFCESNVLHICRGVRHVHPERAPCVCRLRVLHVLRYWEEGTN